MTSLTYRGIRIAFFLLLVIAWACLRVSQAAPLSSARRTKNSSDEQDIEEYKKLSKALENEKYYSKYLKEFETIAKCPFRVINFAGFTRVLCDYSKCTRDNNSCRQDCKQAYMEATDIIPKRRRKKKQVTPADVQMGCIYVPKQRKHSIEAAGPVAAGPVV
jgi:hypothetical protein